MIDAMMLREVIRSPAIWTRLLKGAPEASAPISEKSKFHYRRRWRWMDLLVAFDAQNEAANLLHPRRERK